MSRIRTINHDVPKHKCPVCNHSCSRRPYIPGSQSTGNPQGRPPRELQRFIHVLQNATRREVYLTLADLAEQCEIAVVSVPQYIIRARKRGVDIRLGPDHGYYIAPSKEEPARDSLIHETTSTEMSGPKGS